MTATDVVPETQGNIPNTLLANPEDEKSGTDMNSITEPLFEVSDNEIHISPDKQAQDDTKTEPPPAAAGAEPKSHPLPSKAYGPKWNWEPSVKDYTQLRDGKIIRYRDYQRSGGKMPTTTPQQPQPAPSGPSSQPKPAAQPSEPPPSDTELEGGYEIVDPPPQPRAANRGSISSEKGFSLPPNPPPHPGPTPRQPAPAPPKPLKEYEQALDEGFATVDKPKRFFTLGRIFATVWFEPAGGQNPPNGRKADLEWTDSVPPYHSEKPIAKFRWFIVARKRLHHSLCFNITTVGPNGPRKADRGRGMDFVVLHSSNIEPSEPFGVEGIVKEPIGVIIEAGDESISPWARLDCGRVYTVEDNLRVMKIGRVHTVCLGLLEEYFKMAVA